MRNFIVVVGFAVLLCGRLQAADASATTTPLDRAFHSMYNLDFAAAEREVRAYETRNQSDPLGYVTEAASLLFAEFDRLQVLQAEFFTEDDKYLHRRALVPDPLRKQQFDAALARAEELGLARVKANPADQDALFSLAMENGLKADYAALIERRDWAALGYTKAATGWAQKLLAVAPDFYDAYVSTGIAKYLVSLKSAPMRFIARLRGVEGDRDQGIRELRIAADHGHYLAPFARLLLAIDCLRRKQTGEATEILKGLQAQFPNNTLFRREVGRLEARNQ